MPLLSTSATPRATPSMPSVTMKGGIAPLVMRKPLRAPVKAPVARQPRIPAHHGQSRFEVSMAPATPDSARIEPTDRSMPADEMTKDMPIASTPNTDVDRRMLRTLETERKTFDSAAIATQSATSTTSDSNRTAAAPAKRSRQDAGAAGLEVEVMKPSSKGGEAARYQPTGGLDLTSRIAASGPCSRPARPWSAPALERRRTQESSRRQAPSWRLRPPRGRPDRA